jgi:hypothetical protein
MIKNLLTISITVENKQAILLIDPETYYPIAKEILFQFTKIISQMEDAAKQQQAQVSEALQKELGENPIPDSLMENFNALPEACNQDPKPA